MSTQVVLILAGSAFILVAIAGSVEAVQVKIADISKPGRYIAAVAGCTLVVISFTPLSRADQNQSARAAVPTLTPHAQNTKVTVTPTSSLKMNACKGLTVSLSKEINAILAVNANVMGRSDQPVSINRSGYQSAASREAMTNQAAQTALSAYSGTGLKVPGDQNVATILNDVQSFIARLPNEISQASSSDASEDWGALQDRPNVLQKEIVPAVEKQCTKL